MALFSYSFCMAIVHSLWQSALLVLLYLAATKTLLQKGAPLQKRNFLFFTLASQLVLTGLTFYIYYSGNSFYDAANGLEKSFSALGGNKILQNYSPWLFLLYCLVLSYKLAKTIYTWLQFRQRYKAGLQKPPVELKLFAAQKAYQFGIRRKITVWLSNTIHTPVTFGFFKPVILLPVALVNHISLAQAETLVIHELTHIRTNDYLLNWFLLSAETLFFFNPFIIRLCNIIRMEREKNCDMGVIAFEYSPVLYAETLLQAEKMKQLVPGFQLAAVNRKRQLLDRIRFFSGELDFVRSGRFNRMIPVMGLLLLLLFFSALLVQPLGPSDRTMETSATAVPYLPVSSVELPPVYTNSVSTGNNTLPSQTRELEKRVNNTATSLNKVQEALKATETEVQAAAAALEVQPQTEFVMPAAVTDNDGSKQIIIQEESSGSSKANSVRTYSLRFENGHWILEPIWTFAAKEIREDSLLKKMDSSMGRQKRMVPPQQ